MRLPRCFARRSPWPPRGAPIPGPASCCFCYGAHRPWLHGGPACLELRGPGEFLGTRQSGLPDFAVAELARDQNILAEAREEAFALVRDDPELASKENAAVRDLLFNRWRGRLSLARVG